MPCNSIHMVCSFHPYMNISTLKVWSERVRIFNGFLFSSFASLCMCFLCSCVSHNGNSQCTKIWFSVLALFLHFCCAINFIYYKLHIIFQNNKYSNIHKRIFWPPCKHLGHSAHVFFRWQYSNMQYTNTSLKYKRGKMWYRREQWSMKKKHTENGRKTHRFQKMNTLNWRKTQHFWWKIVIMHVRKESFFAPK